MVINKDSDSVFVALKKETLGKFKQFTFNNEQTGKTMEYNLLFPEGAEAGEKLPWCSSWPMPAPLARK